MTDNLVGMWEKHWLIASSA